MSHSYTVEQYQKVIIDGQPVHRMVITGRYLSPPFYETISTKPLPDGRTVVVYRDTDPNLSQNAQELMHLGAWK